MRLIFMGSPMFSVPVLESLVNHGHEILGVYTQTDKPKGRSGKSVFCPVKAWAVSHGFTVYSPVSLKKQAVIDQIKSLNADAIIVAAYGKILPKGVLNAAPYGCINVHASLLPKYRGAAPVEWAILDGEKETGITIMQMDEGLDTGDILLQKAVEIEDTDTGDSLTLKLSEAGSEPLLTVLDMIEKHAVIPVKQGESPTVYASMLTKEMGRLDFSSDADVLERKIRAFYSWPSAYTGINGKILKIHAASVTEGDESKAPGEVIRVTKKDFTVNCKKGALIIKRLQLEGKKSMDTDAFLRGNTVSEGMILTL